MTASSAAPSGHLLGDPAARRRVVAYGTFECLHCRRAWPALRALAADPSLLVEAAAEQGAYWALHEALMDAPTPLWPERVEGVARALGLDLARLRRDAASDAVAARVEAQRLAAAADGVRGTPAAFLAGARLELGDVETLRGQVAAGA